MERQIMWSPQVGPGLECLRLLQLPDGVLEGDIALRALRMEKFCLLRNSQLMEMDSS